MAIVRNATLRPLDLTSGRTLASGDTANVDPAAPHEAALISEGKLVITDGTVAPSPEPSPITDIAGYAGDYQATVNYRKGLLVSKGGNLYLALRPSTGADPATNPDKWELVASSGGGAAPAQGSTIWVPKATGAAATDLPNINTALAQLAGKAGAEVKFDPGGGPYKVDGPMVLPQFPDPAADHPEWWINFNRAEIQGVGNKTTPFMKDVPPANEDDAQKMLARRIEAVDVILDARDTTGPWVPGIQLLCSYGSHFERIVGLVLHRTLDLAYTIDAKIVSVINNDGDDFGIVLRSAAGLYPGAVAADSGCNGTTLDHCRNVGRTGQTAAFAVFDSDGVGIDDCISEGGNPVNDVLLDNSQAPTVVKTARVRNLHSEHNGGPTNAVIKANLIGCDLRLEDSFIQGLRDGGVIADASDSGGSLAIHCRFPYLVPGWKFKTNRATSRERWYFEPCEGTAAGYHPEESVNWIDVSGGADPKPISGVCGWRFDQTTGGLRYFGTGQMLGFVASTPIYPDPDAALDLGYKGANSNRFRKLFLSDSVYIDGAQPFHLGATPALDGTVAGIEAALRQLGLGA